MSDRIVAVTDLAASIDFYITLTEGTALEARDGSRARVTSPRGSRLLLVVEAAPVLQTVAVAVHDVEAAQDRLTAAGHEVLPAVVGQTWGTVTDPSGHTVLIVSQDGPDQKEQEN